MVLLRTKPDHTTHFYKTLQSLQIYNKNLDFCHGPQDPTQPGSLILVTSLILFFTSCFFTHYNQSNWALPFKQVLFRLMILFFFFLPMPSILFLRHSRGLLSVLAQLSSQMHMFKSTDLRIKTSWLPNVAQFMGVRAQAPTQI